MTLDDQLRALTPLDSGVIAQLAEYSTGSHTLRIYRARGATIPPERLRLVARRLRELAEVAERLTTPPPQ